MPTSMERHQTLRSCGGNRSTAPTADDLAERLNEL